MRWTKARSGAPSATRKRSCRTARLLTFARSKGPTVVIASWRRRRTRSKSGSSGTLAEYSRTRWGIGRLRARPAALLGADDPRDVVEAGGAAEDRGVERLRHAGFAAQDPEVLALRPADHGVAVVRREVDHPVVAPHGGQEGQEGRREADLQLRRRSLGVGEAGHPGGTARPPARLHALVDHVQPAVLAHARSGRQRSGRTSSGTGWGGGRSRTRRRSSAGGRVRERGSFGLPPRSARGARGASEEERAGAAARFTDVALPADRRRLRRGAATSAWRKYRWKAVSGPTRRRPSARGSFAFPSRTSRLYWLRMR